MFVYVECCFFKWYVICFKWEYELLVEEAQCIASTSGNIYWAKYWPICSVGHGCCCIRDFYQLYISNQEWQQRVEQARAGAVAVTGWDAPGVHSKCSPCSSTYNRVVHEWTSFPFSWLSTIQASFVLRCVQMADGSWHSAPWMHCNNTHFMWREKPLEKQSFEPFSS